MLQARLLPLLREQCHPQRARPLLQHHHLLVKWELGQQTDDLLIGHIAPDV